VIHFHDDRPTLNRRIRRKTLFRIPWQPKTEDAGWQHGQNPVLAMVFGIASEDSIVIYGSVYHRSPRYKSLIPNPEASYLTRDRKPSFLHFRIIGLVRSGDSDIYLPRSAAFVD
jgi:hypothetical protein